MMGRKWMAIIGGGGVGAIAGAAAGSAVPVLGTVVGAIVGGVCGALATLSAIDDDDDGKGFK
jgi:phage tail tape-measure protein